jgi:hypothetical protein
MYIQIRFAIIGHYISFAEESVALKSKYVLSSSHQVEISRCIAFCSTLTQGPIFS